MGQAEISLTWRRDVCAVLATEQTGILIEWTADARTRYEADSNFEWEFELYDAFKRFLSSPQPLGCLVAMAKPAGETYEFFFQFKGTRFYGKILLRTDRKRIVVFSAHRPLKARLSCD